ncbi:hypothetical protein SROCM77S_02759 [Streptomyces rochei]|uniref:hypothetical protein n=1 Tax=Streptomyces sp. NRRL WC-3795 TaxID=1463938 RepID=UPI00099DA211|nr:hypothetical protein [Streptomyces sp. NRRL WC-3795]
MSDVTRQPGAPAERQTQYPGARGAATPETGPGPGPGPGPLTEGAAHPRPAGESTAPAETPTTAPAGTPATAPAETPATAPAETPATAPAGTPTTAPAGTRAGGPDAAHDGGTLLPHDECDRLGERLRHAVAGFVDAPRASVEEADRVLEEITARFTDAVAQRRRTLRTSWHDTDPDDRATSTDTEQLRLALRDYRGLADRLMRL